MNKIIKYIILYIIGLPVIVFLSCLDGSMSVDDLFDAHFLLAILIGYHVVWACFLYFCQINPRHFIGLLGWPSQKVSLRYIGVLTAFILFMFGWLGGFIAIGIHTGRTGGGVFVASMLGWLLILFIGIYFFFCRGIAIHKNGKIRVFQIKITTIDGGKIERIETEPHGKRTTLYVYISGQRFAFELSTGYDGNACKRLTDTVEELEKFGFDDE